jgi:hypothetical protein
MTDNECQYATSGHTRCVRSSPNHWRMADGTDAPVCEGCGRSATELGLKPPAWFPDEKFVPDMPAHRGRRTASG